LSNRSLLTAYTIEKRRVRRVPTTLFEVESKGLRHLAEGEGLGSLAAGLPDGAYTTLRTFGRDRVVRLAQHVARLNESAGLTGGRGALTADDVRRAIALALQATGFDSSRLRLTFAPPRLFVGIEPFVALPENLYREGVACATVPLRRRNPHAKDTRFAAEATSAYRSLPAGIHEGLMVGADGSILEGLSSNLFAVLGGAIRTEEERALLGVTRSMVIEVARGVLPVVAGAVRVGDLETLSECFITSASRGVLPVVRIDAHTIGAGEPGPVTRQLMSRLEALVEREAERIRLPPL
jgi:branched-chain amino acid aminotransferase